jgi:hypothetical protein
MIAREIVRAVIRSSVPIATRPLITVPSSAIKSCTGATIVRGSRMVTKMDLEVIDVARASCA